MSWWVYLVDKDGHPLSVKNHYSEGGTFSMSGSSQAELNVTYNYSKFYRAYLNPEGLKWLDGKKAKNVTPQLERAIRLLGVKRDHDYWQPTAGNAGHALAILLDWALQHPEGIFVVH